MDLWNKSIYVKGDSGKEHRWAIENKNGKTIYHRFESDSNGNFHWNGSTDGKTASGNNRSLDLKVVPSEVIAIGRGVKK